MFICTRKQKCPQKTDIISHITAKYQTGIPSGRPCSLTAPAAQGRNPTGRPCSLTAPAAWGRMDCSVQRIDHYMHRATWMAPKLVNQPQPSLTLLHEAALSCPHRVPTSHAEREITTVQWVTSALLSVSSRLSQAAHTSLSHFWSPLQHESQASAPGWSGENQGTTAPGNCQWAEVLQNQDGRVLEKLVQSSKLPDGSRRRLKAHTTCLMSHSRTRTWIANSQLNG